MMKKLCSAVSIVFVLSVIASLIPATQMSFDFGFPCAFLEIHMRYDAVGVVSWNLVAFLGDIVCGYVLCTSVEHVYKKLWIKKIRSKIIKK